MRRGVEIASRTRQVHERTPRCLVADFPDQQIVHGGTLDGLELCIELAGDFAAQRPADAVLQRVGNEVLHRVFERDDFPGGGTIDIIDAIVVDFPDPTTPARTPRRLRPARRAASSLPGMAGSQVGRNPMAGAPASRRSIRIVTDGPISVASEAQRNMHSARRLHAGCALLLDRRIENSAIAALDVHIGYRQDFHQGGGLDAAEPLGVTYLPPTVYLISESGSSIRTLICKSLAPCRAPGDDVVEGRRHRTLERIQQHPAAILKVSPVICPRAMDSRRSREPRPGDGAASGDAGAAAPSLDSSMCSLSAYSSTVKMATSALSNSTGQSLLTREPISNSARAPGETRPHAGQRVAAVDPHRALDRARRGQGLLARGGRRAAGRYEMSDELAAEMDHDRLGS